MIGGRPVLVMAVFPNARGFGYAVFEGVMPVDWGVSDVQGPGRNDMCMSRISALLGKYNPEILLRRDAAETRSGRISRLIDAIAALSGDSRVACIAVSRVQIRQAFGYLARPTRQAIAHAIAERIPFFAPLVPPVRKIWNSEDRRMGLFDAAALVMAYLDEPDSGFTAAA